MSAASSGSFLTGCVVDLFSELIRLLVVLRDERKVLMMKHDDGTWDFPYFYFPRAEPRNIEISLLQFQQSLNLDTSLVQFAAIAELLGSFYAKYPKGCGNLDKAGLSKMLLLDSQGELPLELPTNVAWKDNSFVQSISLGEPVQEGWDAITGRVAKFLQEEIFDLRTVWQPRHQLGWYKKACMWLQHVVQEDSAHILGPVVQCRMSCLSTILKANSAVGAYFLKSPALGTNEIQITQVISEVLSSWTLTLVGVSEELASLVSREFIPFENCGEDQELRSVSINSLGSLHRTSLGQKQRLIEGGCAVLDSSALLAELWKWKEESDSNLSALMSDFESTIPLVAARLTSLDDYKIPLTLTHGDLSFSNVGFEKDTESSKRAIFFDWHFAAISHPLYDFHMIHEELSDPERDQYLQTWCDYEPMDRLRKAYEIAYPLGWLLKLRGLTLAKRHGTPELNSELDMFFSTAWGIMKNHLPPRSQGTATG